MTDYDFARKLARVERAVGEVERLVSGAGLDASRELLHAVLDVHRDAVQELVQALGAADGMLPPSLGRPKVAWLLGLHGINPDPLEFRVEDVLRATSAALSVSARAELVAVDGERVRVRIEGGGEESRRLLARAVERALAELAPEASITIDGVTLARRESELFALERLVPRREVRSP